MMAPFGPALTEAVQARLARRTNGRRSADSPARLVLHRVAPQARDDAIGHV